MKTGNIPQEETSTPVTLEELQNVLYKMNFYKREWGFIANDLSGKLTFFDSEPSFGGAYVTKEDILNYIQEY
jgi:hypothetical protein